MGKSHQSRYPGGDASQLMLAALFVLAFMFAVCSAYTPRWETNDDIAMSMVAHGYGLAASASPNIIFSNVVWGYIVRAIPTINGVLGYSIATLAALAAAGTGIFYFSRKLGLAWFSCALLTALVLLRPTIYPQFTLNSGLLTVAVALGVASYAKSRQAGALVAAAVFAVLAFVIRSQQFILVLAAALPFLPLKQLAKDRTFLLFAALTLATILCAACVDWAAYRGPEWDYFFEVNKARAGYTDFGLAEQLKNHPSIISAYGYSSNDLDLLRSFFFSDPLILKPKALNAMAGDLGALPFISANFPLAYDAVRSLYSSNLLPLTLLAGVLFLARPTRKAAAAFVLVLGFAFILGLIGRGGLERVLAPLLAMLAVFSALCVSQGGAKPWAVQLLALLALAGSLWVVTPQANITAAEIRMAQDEARKSPATLLFSWGVGVRIESIFPLLASDSSLRNMKIYGMGVFTHAPFSRAHLEEIEGRGLVHRIRSADGILMVASKGNIDSLKIWCHERYRATLLDETVFSGSMTEIQHVKCE